MLKLIENITINRLLARFLLNGALVLGISCIAQAQDSQAKLEASTKKCVTLNKGNICYKELLITWKHAAAGNYCLISSQQPEPIECWDNALEGKLSYKFESAGDVRFTLQERETDKQVATTLVRVVWVYKNDPKSHNSWRLF